MDEKELEKRNRIKENIKKHIDRLFSTTSVTAEESITKSLIEEVVKAERDLLIEIAKESDVFGKCVLHYRLPIDFRLDIDLSKASEVSELDRKTYWADYKIKLDSENLNPEELYNKKILMACTLHVPLKEEDNSGEQ